MSYSVECQVCHYRLPVDDPAAPPVECPECGSFYSLLPANERPAIYVPQVLRDLGFDPAAPPPRPDEASSRQKRKPVRSDSPLAVLEPEEEPAPPPQRLTPALTPTDEPRPAIPVGRLEVPGARSAVPVARPAIPAARPVIGAAVDDDDSAGVTPFDLLGPGAVLLGVGAAICAWTGGWPALVVPLSAAGLLLALVSVVLTGGARGSRLWPLSGAIVSGAVLVFVLVPGLSGVFAGRPKSPAAGAMRVVALVGHELPDDVATAEWVDASRAAIQQDQVGVQVTSATLGPIETFTAPRKKTITPEKYLVVRIRVQRVAGKLRLKADKEDEPDPVFERPRAILTDEGGKAFKPATIGIETDTGPLRGPAEEAFVFEAPPASAKLRLEIPATPWGGTGSFKFALPSTMIRPGATRGGRPSGS